MKILFVDTILEGHHLWYLNSLIENREKCVVLIPDNIELSNNKIKKYFFKKDIKKDFFNYLDWMKVIGKIAKLEKVDIIHFLDGDAFIKYFGIGFQNLKRHRIIVTFHHFRYSLLRNIARKMIFSNIAYGVVHTKSLLTTADGLGISNCVHIEYPQFSQKKFFLNAECRKYFSIPDDKVPVLAAIGGTRYDKGLDILLDALNSVNNPFYLLIAGKEEAFDEIYIKEKSQRYSNRVFAKLSYLTDDEISLATNAADIIVLPYRYSFDGASGPLADGVEFEKQIIGPEHGSIGDLIRTNHIGRTFKTEDARNLTEVIESALQFDFSYDETAVLYKKSLSPIDFQKKYDSLYAKICNIDA